eukprot:UN18423
MDKKDVDICARIISNGALHHAYTGTGSVALATAAAIDGTVVNNIINKTTKTNNTTRESKVRIGHTSGSLENTGQKQLFLKRKSGM